MTEENNQDKIDERKRYSQRKTNDRKSMIRVKQTNVKV